MNPKQKAESSAWLGGHSSAYAKKFVTDNKLKLRKGTRIIWNQANGTIKSRAVIECWSRDKRRYLPFEFAETPWFESAEERDAVLEAIT